MKLQDYIQSLLYRHDCVIVPDFGGFITNKVGVRIENDTHFFPPYKKLGFNENLSHNDGLLANQIAASLNISFHEATKQILLEVERWKQKLEIGELFIENIGKFQYNQKQHIVFEPIDKVNYLAHSFGLESYKKEIIQRKQTKTVAALDSNQKKTSAFVKYAASAAILLSLGFFGWQGYQQQQQRKEYANQERKLEQKIQTATFIIDTPLPTIELNVTREKNKIFHILAGSFKFEKNAAKKVENLRAKGYNAHIIGKNKWGLTQVAFNSYASKDDAYKDLVTIRENESKDAWLLIKRLE